jgi:hypothetical protein
MAAPSLQTEKDPAMVLKKAFLRAVDFLHVNRSQIEAILGVSPATISRLYKSPKQVIDPKSKEGEIALIFVRIFRSLDSLFGGNVEQAKTWMHSYNTHLEGVPLELLSSLRGLFDVAGYLDAIRGKV